MKAPAVFTKSGAKSTAKVTLPKSVFSEVPEKHDLLQQAYVSYLANGRVNLATTKRRGEVRGGGRKPWRQKGTGRARVGSIRSPLWRGGGITFGPSGEERYTKKMHKSARKKAVRQALSVALEEGSIKIIESLSVKEGRTKEFTSLRDKMKLDGSILLVVNDKNDLLLRAVSNVKNVSCVRAQHLNVFDILNADTVLIEKPALDVISNWLGDSA